MAWTGFCEDGGAYAEQPNMLQRVAASDRNQKELNHGFQTTDFTDFTDETSAVRINSLSVKSVVQFSLVAAGCTVLLAKPFQFMFAWQMQRQPLEEVVISPEISAVNALGRERKMLASKSLGKSPHRFGSIHLAIVIHEQAVV